MLYYAVFSLIGSMIYMRGKNLSEFDINKKIKEIANDNLSGSKELAKNALECLISFSERSDSESSGQFYEELLHVGKKIVGSQPSMAPLFNVVNRVLFEAEVNIEQGVKLERLKRIVISTCNEILVKSEKGGKLIAHATSELIKDPSIILTHSYSSTIVSSLIIAKSSGREFKVFVTESRPLLEGRKTAQKLEGGGINTTLIADAASFYFLNKIDLILVGADCICYEGVVNKIGTKGLAIAASEYGVPLYVLAEENKFLPVKYRKSPVILEKNQDELLGEDYRDLKALNIYFDITPFKFITGIVTENGLISETEVRNSLENLKVSKGLLNHV